MWGEDSSDFSSFVVSVAPLSPATRPGVIDLLTGQGLNSSTEDAAQIYWILGDDSTGPAQFNAIRADSWISVLSTKGGQAAFRRRGGDRQRGREHGVPGRLAPPIRL